MKRHCSGAHLARLARDARRCPHIPVVLESLPSGEGQHAAVGGHRLVSARLRLPDRRYDQGLSKVHIRGADAGEGRRRGASAVRHRALVRLLAGHGISGDRQSGGFQDGGHACADRQGAADDALDVIALTKRHALLSLRGAWRRSIQFFAYHSGLLRFARSDEQPLCYATVLCFPFG
jgi:hypothetical protein